MLLLYLVIRTVTGLCSCPSLCDSQTQRLPLAAALFLGAQYSSTIVESDGVLNSLHGMSHALLCIQVVNDLSFGEKHASMIHFSVTMTFCSSNLGRHLFQARMRWLAIFSSLLIFAALASSYVLAALCTGIS